MTRYGILIQIDRIILLPHLAVSKAARLRFSSGNSGIITQGNPRVKRQILLTEILRDLDDVFRREAEFLEQRHRRTGVAELVVDADAAHRRR